MVIFTFTILLLIFVVLNRILNSRFKHWEYVVVPPSIFILFVIIVLLILNLFVDGNPLIALIALVIYFESLDLGTNLHKRITKSHSDEKLKIIDLNTLYFGPNIEQSLADFLQSKDADIIILQELFSNKDRINFPSKGFIRKASFDHFLPQPFVHQFFPSYPYMVMIQDKGVLSKTPITIIKEHISKIHAFGYLIASTTFNGVEIIIINVHMPRIFKNNIFFEDRKRLFNLLYEDIKYYKSINKNLILTGDFNATKASRFIQKLFKLLNESITENRFGFISTWHTDLPLWRLDYLFYNRSKKFYLSNSHVFDSNDFSDHMGLEVNFIVKNS